eukprot:1833665-Rhodomonas_salina.1
MTVWILTSWGWAGQVTVIMKLTSNIAKTFAIAISLVVSTIASIYLFNFIVTVNFVWGRSLSLALSLFLPLSLALLILRAGLCACSGSSLERAVGMGAASTRGRVAAADM